MKNELKISFKLFGTKISPNEITRLTSISPSTALLEGERNKALNLPRKNLWVVESDADSDLLEDHWNCLKDSLIEAKVKIRELAETGEATLSIVIDSSSRVPSITIPPSMSGFAAFVNAVIDIDHLQK